VATILLNFRTIQRGIVSGVKKYCPQFFFHKETRKLRIFPNIVSGYVRQVKKSVTSKITILNYCNCNCGRLTLALTLDPKRHKMQSYCPKFASPIFLEIMSKNKLRGFYVFLVGTLGLRVCLEELVTFCTLFPSCSDTP
jgi:hypothetical protein